MVIRFLPIFTHEETASRASVVHVWIVWCCSCFVRMWKHVEITRVILDRHLSTLNENLMNQIHQTAWLINVDLGWNWSWRSRITLSAVFIDVSQVFVLVAA